MIQTRRVLGILGAGSLGLAVGAMLLPPAAPEAGAQQPQPRQATPPQAAPAAAAANPTENAGGSYEQQLSYALGLNMGESLRADNVPLDVPSFAAGVSDALAGGEPKMSQEQCIAVLQRFQQIMMQRAQQAAVDNQQKGAAYLATNGKKPGVQTTDSGLQYRVIKQGDGATPTATDTVKAHYEGRLIDGSVFDSSYQRGEPSEFPVGRVIAGWTEALQLMKVGDKWELAIPSDIAYGSEGRPPKIGPNETLLFTIELVDVK